MKRALFIFVLLLFGRNVFAAERIAIIVDTSGSMNQNDVPRYAAQIAKIIGDLVDDDDSLMLIRMPGNERAMVQSAPPNNIFGVLNQLLNQNTPVENCSPSPANDLTVELRGADRASFKAALDRLL